ncbi:class I SAM-dependent methyltransferase [Frigoriglobus tundricola]|uniref:Methyltransferase type 11 domain-containing protein n=1 Tax=Frigoriglobus tundricola TaxID=2774151 RepID=A0A6M5YH38_9BACT|nr:class I SAM-dependent methyltransferase [Frigoriglobus tundricola]QJW93298.1 hypothetical protein FTUN_0804 [Frigoriglobus tundricola]
MAASTPDYDQYQSAFHSAFRAELYSVLDGLPLPADGRVLDVPCGNGFYSARLATRLGAGGRLIAVDASEEYVAQARAALADTSGPGATEVVAGNAYELPYGDQSFDLVWCAQSLISLEPERVVREMRRVVRADGTVAILEVDQFHHVLLPWPAELEAALASAVLKGSVRQYGDGVKTSPTRHLRRVLKENDFGTIRRVTVAIDRAAPFDAATTEFLDHHFENFRSIVHPHLTPSLRKVYDRVTDPAESDSLYHRPESELVCINAVYLARPHSGGS